MTEHEPKHGSWWTTAPGLLTAFAGTITAVGGLIAVLAQAGLLGGKNDRSSVSLSQPGPAAADKEQPSPDKGTSPSVPTGDSPAPVGHSPIEANSELRGQSFKRVVITQTDGKVVSLNPTTFVVRGSASGFLLRYGQQINFDLVSVVEVIGEDRLRFTLVNGQKLEEDVEGVFYGVAGTNQLGPYSSHIKQIRRFDFVR